jgi:translation elongation factor EF-1beta
MQSVLAFKAKKVAFLKIAIRAVKKDPIGFGLYLLQVSPFLSKTKSLFGFSRESKEQLHNFECIKYANYSVNKEIEMGCPNELLRGKIEDINSLRDVICCLLLEDLQTPIHVSEVSFPLEWEQISGILAQADKRMEFFFP